MAVPPPPPGFQPDPLASVNGLANITSGYRDPRRNRRVGGVPNSKHMDADALDLTPREGVSWGQLRSQADTIAAQWGRGARVVDESKTGKPHIHLQLPGWGGAPGLPKPPAGFAAGSVAAQVPPPNKGMFAPPLGRPTGQVHDGDTFRLSSGQNARLQGFDAFELGQQGRRRDGSLVPLGMQSRDFLSGSINPQSVVTPTGQSTYGRPVVTVGPNDPALPMLRNGLGLAAPEYLKGSPLFTPYMEAERQARMTRTGGFATNAETPSQYRHKSGPWQGAEPGEWGSGQAVFGDEPTPFMGLRPEIEKGYLAIWNDPGSKPEDLIAYAKANGFEVSEEFTRKQYAKRFKDGDKPDSSVQFMAPPRLLTDVGDGANGAFVRGFGDPINMLDELGGLADTVVPGARDFDGPRENIWNSDRRFGDILWNNIDANRSILQSDDEKHPIARFGGQMSSALIMPGVATEGAAARATAKALEEGATGFAAARLGTQAATRRAGIAGAAEGGLAGFGAGEGGVVDRLPNTAAGAAAGGFGGYVLGGLYGEARALYLSLRAKGVPEAEAMQAAQAAGRVDPHDVGLESAAIVNDGAQSAGPTPASRVQPRGGVVANDDHIPGTINLGGPVPREFQQRPIFPDGKGGFREGTPDEIEAALSQSGIHYDDPYYRDPSYAPMRMEDDSPELVGPLLDRERDYINVSPPPPPPGFAPEAPFGITRPLGERLGADERANLIRGLDPENVVPMPNTGVNSLDDAMRVPGRFEELQAPNPLNELGVRQLPGNDLFKPRRIRGPLDITKKIRDWGGVRDDGGDLASLGITNAPRKGLEFGGNEFTLGRLINPRGMSLDDVGERLWDEGYFPERPTVSEVINILHREHLGDSLYHPESLNEVEAFRAAQEEADRISRYRDEGAPLVDERGEPASLQDQLANTPPAWAYEDIARLSKRVGNIDTGKLETRQDITRALEAVSNRVGGFDAALRGKQSWAETEALAREMGLTPEAVMSRRAGQALNAEEAVALRMMFAKGSDELVALAKKAKGGDEEALARFHQAALQHAAIYEHVAGSAAEAGRALQSYRMVAKASLHQGRVLKGLVEGAGGTDRLREMADKIIELEKVPGALNKFAANMTKPTWKDKLVELWYNSLLSGPQTHAVNILSNTITASAQPFEHLAAAGIGAVRSGISRMRGKGDVDRVLMSEVGPRVVGLTQGAAEGLKAFKYTLRTGEVADQVTKVESARQEAISGIKGKIIRVPTHLLSAEDEFFKATARRMEVAGLAVRKARAEGLKGDALQKRIAELTSNPTPDMVEQSMDYARYLTFQRPLGPTMQHVMAITQNQPWLKLFMPFVRTPANILKFGIERSPFAPMLKEVRNDIAAGGAKRDLAAAKMALGTGLGFLVTQWAQSGLITGGGPQDENAKRLLEADGWKPYSIKLGDTYYSYKRLDPLASTLGVAADMVDLQSHMTERQRQEVPMLVISSFMQNLENKTWLSGLGDLHEALTEPQRYAHEFVERLAGSLATPALSGQIARTIDPVQRETGEGWVQGILDGIRSRVPGLSQGLYPRRDAFGGEVRNEGGVGPDLASPIFTGTARHDPVVSELLRTGANVGRLSRDVGGTRLNDQQFDQYQRRAGELTHQSMEALVTSPEWRGLSMEQQRKALDDVKKAARKAAREELGVVDASEGDFVPPPPPPGFFALPSNPAPHAVSGMFAPGPR